MIKNLILVVLILLMSFFAFGYGIEANSLKKDRTHFGFIFWSILFAVIMTVIIWG